MSWKCHDSDLECLKNTMDSHLDHRQPATGPSYGLNWFMGRCISEWLVSKNTKTRRSLKKGGGRRKFMRGTWFGSNSKIGVYIHPMVMIIGSGQHSWMCWGPLFTDLRSYERARRIVSHNGVSSLWHFLIQFELNCVSKVGLIHRCARAYHYAATFPVTQNRG